MYRELEQERKSNCSWEACKVFWGMLNIVNLLYIFSACSLYKYSSTSSCVWTEASRYLLGEGECSSCPWEMGVDGVLSQGCWSRWQLPWGESRGTSHSCIAGPHGNTNTHLHSQHWASWSNELVKCAYLWTVGLSWSAWRGATRKQEEQICKNWGESTMHSATMSDSTYLTHNTYIS